MVQCNFCTREKGLIIPITHAMGFKAILVEKKNKTQIVLKWLPGINMALNKNIKD